MADIPRRYSMQGLDSVYGHGCGGHQLTVLISHLQGMMTMTPGKPAGGGKSDMEQSEEGMEAIGADDNQTVSAE